MKTLSYTAEKNGVEVEVLNRLMVSEYQINDLLDSLVANGYTINSTRVEDGDYSPHWQGQSLSVLPDKITELERKQINDKQYRKNKL